MADPDQLATFLERPSMHLCVDMQRMFSEETPWRTPWSDDVRPVIQKLVELHPARAVFTRLMPPAQADDAPGAWADYYRQWHAFTLNEIDPALLDLTPEIARHASRARIFDKAGYSAFTSPGLHSFLAEQRIETLIVTGVETDVCVLSTVMSAVDLGFRVVLAKDALCSSTDETHDALLRLYARRFNLQVELSDSDAIRERWRV